MSKVTFTEGVAPSAPSANQVVMYAKTDGQIYSKDDAGAESALTSDEKVRVSSNDSTPGFLNGKLLAGTNTTLTENNDGGNETLTISGKDEKLKISNADTTPGFLEDKVQAGSNITITKINTGANEKLQFSASGGGGGEVDPATTLLIYEDFVTGAEDPDELGTYTWRTSQNGTGTPPTRINAETGRPGIMQIGSGAAGATRSCIHLGESGLATILPIGFETIFECSLRLVGTLTTFSRAMFGLGDITGAHGDQVNGIYFALDKVLAESNWHLVGSSASAQTRNNTSQAVVSNTWYRMRFTVNAAGNSIQAAINGVNVGSPVTTNIPAGALSPFFKMDGIAGGSNVLMHIDYMKIKMSGLTR